MRLMLAMLAAVALAACGAPSAYDEQDQSNFMNSCRTEGGSEAACACVWAKVEAQIPRAEMEALEAGVAENSPIRQQIVGFAQECAGLQN